MMEAVAEELQCPICLELFHQPIILPCSHILCRAPCAERLFDNGFVRCPVCRDNCFVTGGVQSLPRVISLENIIEHYQGGVAPQTEQPAEVCGKDDIACQLCEKTQKKAKKSCLDCKASYCESCLRLSHPAREPFSQHQLVEPRRYPKPRDLLCTQHEMKVNIFCQDCRQLGCLLCADDHDSHPGHKILSLDQAAQEFTVRLQEGLLKIDQSQQVVTSARTALQDKQTAFRCKVSERRSQLNQQCDSLLREVEMKRELFLSDLEFEEKSKTKEMGKYLEQYEEHVTNLHNLQHFGTEVLEEPDTRAFLQLAMKVSDRLSKNLVTSENLPNLTASTNLTQKVLDLRHQRAKLRSMEYLTVPGKPDICVPKCSRSVNSVVLMLCAPLREDDIIDEYQVFYCSAEQKRLGDQQAMVFKMPVEGRHSSRHQNDYTSVCLIHENLESGVMYYFCVQAYNQAGASEMSDIVNCPTLARTEAGIRVPEITEAQSRTYTFSIQIYSTSPLEVEADDDISHLLLYRESGPDRIWKSIQMYDRANHRVFGLESDTTYDFIVMACHKGGEGQVSKAVSLRTERAAC